MDAPLLDKPPVQKEGESAPNPEDFRTWFYYEQDLTAYYKWKDSLFYILDFCEKNGPFDGILGFSQGCVLSTLLIAMSSNSILQAKVDQDTNNGVVFLQKLYKECKEAKYLEKQAPFRFCIFVGSFLPRALDLKKEFATMMEKQQIYIDDVPTVHIIGKLDQIIPYTATESHTKLFTNNLSRIVYHEGGHAVPSTKEVAEVVTSFLNSIFMESKL